VSERWKLFSMFGARTPNAAVSNSSKKYSSDRMMSAKIA